MLKLARRAKGHFMTLIEIRVHLIRCKPGHISQDVAETSDAFIVNSRTMSIKLLLLNYYDFLDSCLEMNPRLM